MQKMRWEWEGGEMRARIDAIIFKEGRKDLTTEDVCVWVLWE